MPRLLPLRVNQMLKSKDLVDLASTPDERSAAPSPLRPSRQFGRSWQRSLGLWCCVLALGAGILVAARTPRPPRPAEPIVPESIATGQRQPGFLERWRTAVSGRRPGKLPSTYRGGEEDESRIAVAVAEVATVAWFFVVGASIGSFLNVVAYRLPRGMSLSRPKSHCPACGHLIRRSDNVPIIGWLRLRGRCRDCNARISIRYPLVELVSGVIFVALLSLELLSGGESLPMRTPNLYAGVVWTLWYTKWDLVGIYLYQVFLLSILGAVVLIADDAVRMPRKLIVLGLVVGLIAPMGFAGLRPVPMSDWGAFARDWVRGLSPALTDVFHVPTMSSAAAILVEGVVGAVVGLLCGVFVREGIRPRPAENAAYATIPLVLAIVGAFLGWQAAVSVGLMVAMTGMVVLVGVTRSLPSEWQPRWEWFLGAAALVQVLFWRSLETVDRWPGSAMTMNTAAFATANLSAMTLTTRFITSFSFDIESEGEEPRQATT